MSIIKAKDTKTTKTATPKKKSIADLLLSVDSSPKAKETKVLNPRWTKEEHEIYQSKVEAWFVGLMDSAPDAFGELMEIMAEGMEYQYGQTGDSYQSKGKTIPVTATVIELKLGLAKLSTGDYIPFPAYATTGVTRKKHNRVFMVNPNEK